MKILLLTLTTLASAFAMARGTNEYFFQPSAKGHAVDIGYRYGNAPIKTESPDADMTRTSSDLIVRYQYGLNENNALGVYTFVGSQEARNDVSGSADVHHTANGMGDIHLTYKGFMDVWHYGADLGVNTEKVKVGSSGLPNNRSTGGMGLDLYFGGLWTSNSWNYGGKLEYDILFDREWDDNANTKIKDGNMARIAGFSEYNYGHGFVGGELSYTMVGDLKTENDSGTTKEKADSYLGVMLYGTYDFTDMVEGLLSIQDLMHNKHDLGTGSIKAFSETNLFAGVRLNF